MEKTTPEVKGTVLVEIDVPSLLKGRFDIKWEVASVLEQNDDWYSELEKALISAGKQDIAKFLEKKISSEYIVVNLNEAAFHGFNELSNSVEISIPYSLYEEAIRKDIRESEKHTVIEVCQECMREIELRWDVRNDGYKAYCPVCGSRLMLCDECQHDSDGNCTDDCDYDAVTNTCKHSRPE